MAAEGSVRAMYDLTIERAEDWGQLSNQGLGTIVDPMVYRIGQVS
jgi:hypothetical protein